MGTVILATVIMIFPALYFLRRRRRRFSLKEQYLSPSGLRWLRTHLPILVIGTTLAAVVTRLAK